MRSTDDGTPPSEGRPQAPRRVHAEVFGCQMNKLDAQIGLEALLDGGCVRADGADDADIIVFFTCAVRQHAEDRFFSNLGAYERRKARRPGLLIAVAGCVAEEHGGTLLRKFPFVDLVCGTRHFHRLPELLAQVRPAAPIVATGDASVTYARRRSLDPRPAQAYVSVMRGCSLACAYCIVPSVRGPEVSRPPEEIRREIEALAGRGVKDVTLLGQTVNSYGRSLGAPHSLATLLSGLADIAGLARLSFVTSHPRFMDDALIDAVASLPVVCEGLHLPAQSGSNAVLRRMGRSYTAERYLEIIEKCRARIPDFAPAGDFIVGFPGETEEDFRATEDLMRAVRYQNVFVFKYSPRPGTRAAALPDDVPAEVKQARNARLLALQREIALPLYREEIGRTIEVLVEGPSRRSAARFTGRTRSGKIVLFPPVDAAGELVKVRIEDATHLALYGTAIAGGADAAR
ncbi:MAG TPA: tRNA (N6-isopentenyl adenosine(37)-C2)-methylthiotransferase MiaB [Planctomycetes bacterium]|nr:tRNA (N6-isopentenyl adenosine(37)-C2)-methylthiotransferase MiaB [Planctomycetota bacterium]